MATEAATDTIVALATPAGAGALAVVRMSGTLAREIRGKVAPGTPRASHRMGLSAVVDREGHVVDEGLVVEMHGPHSYTGEDSVEFHLHGSEVIAECVVEACIAAGARLARPGEFTMRAFLAGKLGLDQAESVADLIASRSKAQSRLAAHNLRVGLAPKLDPLIHRLEGVLAAWRAAYDFPEHPTGDGMRETDQDELRLVQDALAQLIEEAEPDLFRPKKVVLCGAPNAGKSSLLNALTGKRRAIVTPEAGTTRDAIEVEMSSGLSRWSLWDTAGLREGAGSIENEGINIAREHIDDADLVLWVVDAEAPASLPGGLDAWTILNKIDIARPSGEFDAEVSATTGEGIGLLRESIAQHFSPRHTEGRVVRRRQLDHLKAAHEALMELISAIGTQTPLDALAFHLEEATRELGAVLGREVDVRVLDRIFAEFCIGK